MDKIDEEKGQLEMTDLKPIPDLDSGNQVTAIDAYGEDLFITMSELCDQRQIHFSYRQ